MFDSHMSSSTSTRPSCTSSTRRNSSDTPTCNRDGLNDAKIARETRRPTWPTSGRSAAPSSSPRRPWRPLVRWLGRHAPLQLSSGERVTPISLRRGFELASRLRQHCTGDVVGPRLLRHLCHGRRSHHHPDDWRSGQVCQPLHHLALQQDEGKFSKFLKF